MSAPHPAPLRHHAAGISKAAALFFLFVLGTVAAPAQTSLSAPPAGTSEAGVPNFVVLGPEALGLSAAPTDLHQLPDGRWAAAALRQIAIGDGVRWEVFNQQREAVLSMEGWGMYRMKKAAP